MIRSYKIRNIEIKPGLVLSPMSGVTTSPLRRLLRELNPGAIGLLVSEFISVEAMTRRVPRTLDMMRFHEMERPFCIQLFGFDIERMRDAARMCQDAGVDIVDINCGCPAPKVVRKGGGCELMRQPTHLAALLREVRRALSIPLTLKMRAGWDESSRNALEIARLAEAEGVEALAVHGRTRAQLYRGTADWDLVAQVAASVKIPVAGSGDVTTREGAAAHLSRGISGIFIGRGALANPYVFSEMVDGIPRNLRQDPLRVVAIAERYLELLEQQFSPKACIGKMKQLISQMARGHPWRRDLCRMSSIEEQRELLRQIKESGGVWAGRGFQEDPRGSSEFIGDSFAEEIG